MYGDAEIKKQANIAKHAIMQSQTKIFPLIRKKCIKLLSLEYFGTGIGVSSNGKTIVLNSYSFTTDYCNEYLNNNRHIFAQFRFKRIEFHIPYAEQYLNSKIDSPDDSVITDN